MWRVGGLVSCCLGRALPTRKGGARNRNQQKLADELWRRPLWETEAEAVNTTKGRKGE